MQIIVGFNVEERKSVFSKSQISFLPWVYRYYITIIRMHTLSRKIIAINSRVMSPTRCPHRNNSVIITYLRNNHNDDKITLLQVIGFICPVQYNTGRR